MPRFEVPPDYHPGMNRASVGFFTPGDVIELPDEASKTAPDGEIEPIPLRMIPLDEEGYQLLVVSKERVKKMRAEAKEAAKTVKQDPALPEIRKPPGLSSEGESSPEPVVKGARRGKGVRAADR